MAKTDQELIQEEINKRQYMYGGLGPFSQFLSGERREIIRPESTEVVGFGAGPTGVEYITETIPAEYGPVEYDPSYSPIRRSLSTLGDILYEAPSFFGLRGPDEQVEAMQGVGSSLRDALFGSAEYMSEQARAAASGGEYFDPETGRTVAFDPTVTMFGGNPAEGAVMGSGFRMGRRAAEAAESKGFDTENIFLHGTSDRIEQPRSSATQSRDSGFIGRGFYGATEPRISDFYANSAPARFRDESGSFSDANVFPYVTRRGNYKQYSLAEKQDLARRVRNDEFLSQEITQKNIDDGFIGAEVVDAEGNIIERVNYFPEEDTRSAFLEADLYSGGRTGTAIATGSSLRNFMPGEFEYDAGFGVRARERDQINQTEFRYSPSVVEEPKEISIFDLEGRPFVTTQSDRTDAGRSLLGVGEVDFDIPVELLGGQGYMFRNPGELWASGSGVTPKIYEPAMLAKKNFALGGTLEDPLLLPYRMSPKGSDFSHMTTDTMLTYARNAMDSKTIRRADSEIKSVFPEFKGIQNPESMRQLSSQPDPIRGRVRDILDKNFRYEGSLDLPTTRLAITEPGQYAALLGGLQNVGQFDLSQGLFRGTHPSYPSTVPGYGLGQLKEKDISIFELMPEYVQYRGPVRTMYSKSGKPYQVGIDPTFRTNPVQTEIYSMQTGVRGAPGQQDPNRAMQFTGVITEDILRGIEARRAQ